MDSPSKCDAVGDSLTECAEYWQTRLTCAEPPVLPPETLESLTDLQYSTRTFDVDLKQESAGLRPETYFTAEWALLLGRYSESQQDVVFGTAAAPRDGGSSDTLPFRATWTSGITIESLT